MTVSNRFSHKSYKTRYKVFAGVIIVIFMIISIRLWYMQVVKAGYYKDLAENNRIRLKTIKAMRGKIYDRNGVTLVDNYPYFNLAVIPENVKDIDALLDNLAYTICVDKAKLKEKIHAARFKPPFKPVVLLENLSRADLSKIEAHKLNMPGIEIIVESVRHYPFKKSASHIIGYLSEINSQKLALEKYKGYKAGDLIGNFGIEKVYESLLRGKDGFKEVEVDAFGRELTTLTMREAQPGSAIYLTLDAKLQQFVEAAFVGSAGAVVVMDVKNGGILAQFSKPNFDPSLFVKGISSKDWKILSEDPFLPLQNKVISGQYSPGSVFKLVTAAAALEEGIITKDSTFFCNGSFRLGSSRFSCWKKAVHGKINLIDAIAQSCDVYFYNIGGVLGVNSIAEYANKFGLGEMTNIDLEYEKHGLIPTTLWKRRALKSTWFKGETISVAIGQSYVLVTPLQVALLTATIANGEYIPAPHLVREFRADKDTREDQPLHKMRKLPIQKETIDIIREGMFGVMYSAHGTARGSKPESVTAAGKTGTVQVFSGKTTTLPAGEEIPYELRDHAWFVSYAPAENPQIAISVLVEHGGHGGSAAAPIAKKIIDFYFTVIKGDGDNV